MERITFIIVDDEPLALESFAELLPWEEHSYELVGTAANGMQALALIERVRPDIVFTDIRMPIMDGLQLCRKTHQQWPDIKTVILTAYRDFDYAHQALSYNVTDYLLKNQIEPDMVLSLMKRLSMEIEKVRQQKKIHKNHYYQSMILNMATDITFQPDEKRQCCCMLLQYRTPFILEQLPEYRPGDIQLDTEEVIGLAVKDGPLDLQQMIWMDNKTWGLLLFEKDGELFGFPRMEWHLRDLFARLQTFFKERYATEVIAFFDLSYPEPARIKAALEELVAFSAYSVFLREPRFFLYKHFKNNYRNTNSNHVHLRQTIQQVVDAVRHSWVEKLDAGFQLLEDSFSTPCYDLGQFQNVCKCLLEQLDLLWENSALPPMKQYAEDAYGQLVNLTYWKQIWQWFREEYRQLAALSVSANTNDAGRNRRIEQALTYLHENYSQRLTVRRVGEQVGLSEAYFSSLFKQEMGVTFGDYLTSYRINIAKYLIQNGDYKVYELADLTGYASPQYFSQIFQKETGRTPLEYKKYGEGRRP